MSDLVSQDKIEAIVGVPRHPTEHWGRAVSAEQTVYVLHSHDCRQSTADLRDCPYSIALDWGIEAAGVWPLWATRQDTPVRLAIDSDGLLAPDTEDTATWSPAGPGDTPGELVPGEADTPQPVDATFNPAYRNARCGQLSTHAPHVVEHGPDQPRNCPGT